MSKSVFILTLLLVKFYIGYQQNVKKRRKSLISILKVGMNMQPQLILHDHFSFDKLPFI